MNILENIWFLVALSVIGFILLLDPKSSITGSSGNGVLSVFSSPSSGQKFVYRFNGVLILSFFVLSVTLSCLT